MKDKIVEIYNERPLSKGEHGWWLDASGEYKDGTITETRLHDGHLWARLQTRDNDIAAVKLANIWPTRQACVQAEARRSVRQTESFQNSITDIETLVRFLYQHMAMADAIDYDAEAAAIAKAQELLGIDLETEEHV